MAEPDFSTAWATRARRVTHPMPVTLRRLLELKINRNRVLLSAVLCTSIVTLASGSPGQRPGSPGLGSAIVGLLGARRTMSTGSDSSETTPGPRRR